MNAVLLCKLAETYQRAMEYGEYRSAVDIERDPGSAWPCLSLWWGPGRAASATTPPKCWHLGEV